MAVASTCGAVQYLSFMCVDHMCDVEKWRMAYNMAAVKTLKLD